MSGTLYHTPADIVAQLIADLGLADIEPAGTPITGWTVFPLHMPESPDQAIQVKDTAGRVHNRVHVTGIAGEHYGIQILARSAQDPATPYKRIKLILEYFDSQVNRDLVVLDDSGTNRTYRVNAVTRTGPAIPAGNDGRRFFYAGNVIASIEYVEADPVNTGTGS